MKQYLFVTSLLLCVAVSCRATAPATPFPTSMPTPTTTAMPKATANPSATPIPTHPPPTEDAVTHPPTPDLPPEEVKLRQRLGAEGYELAVPAGESLLNWTTVDLNGDGMEEAAVRTCQGSCDQAPAWSEGRFRVLEIEDGDFALTADQAVASTFNFRPSFEVAQVRPDGGMGILEESACGAHSMCLNLYTWDGETYRVISFSGSAMGVLVEADGTVAVGNRDYFTDPLTNGWTGLYRWNGSDYVMESVDFEGPDYEGPAGTVRAYYNAINICVYQRSFHAAYAFLSHMFQAEQPYEAFEAGFADTVRVAIEDLILVEERADGATVTAIITAIDEVDGGEEETAYEVTWELALEEGMWKLDRAQVVVR